MVFDKYRLLIHICVYKLYDIGTHVLWFTLGRVINLSRRLSTFRSFFLVICRYYGAKWCLSTFDKSVKNFERPYLGLKMHSLKYDRWSWKTNCSTFNLHYLATRLSVCHSVTASLTWPIHGRQTQKEAFTDTTLIILVSVDIFVSLRPNNNGWQCFMIIFSNCSS